MRLTKHIREAVIAAALERSEHTANLKELPAMSHRLCLAIMEHMYPDYAEITVKCDQIVGAINELPSSIRCGALPWVRGGSIRVESVYLSHELTGPSHSYVKASDLPKHLVKMIWQWSDIREEALQGNRDLKAQLDSLLHSVSTIEKLRKVWPEVDKVYSFPGESGATLLPAVPIDNINRALSL